jgi:hypothetical protein
MKKLETLRANLKEMNANLKQSETLTVDEREFMEVVHGIMKDMLDGVAEDILTMQSEIIRLRNENEALKGFLDDVDIERHPMQ